MAGTESDVESEGPDAVGPASVDAGTQPGAWFYLHPGTQQTYGPYTVASLVELARSGFLVPSLPFAHAGGQEWAALSDVAELRGVYEAIPEEMAKVAGQPAAADSAPGASQATARQPSSQGADGRDADAPGPAGAPDRLQAHLAKRQRATVGQRAETVSHADLDMLRFQTEVAGLMGRPPPTAAAAAPAPVPGPPEEREFVDDDGTRYVWDEREGRYVPAPAGPVPTYSVDDMVFQAEGTPADPPTKDPPPADPPGKPPQAHTTTCVYIQGLPDDVTEEEVAEVFSKCGIIREDENRVKKIKIYRNKQTGRPKGDALVTFLKRPSVDLALQILDGAPFRPDGLPIKVMEAQFDDKAQGGNDRGAEQGGKAKGKPGVSRGSKRRRTPAQEQLLHWAGDDEMQRPQEVVVVLEGVFDPQDMAVGTREKKEALLAALMKDMARFGRVDKVRVFPQHPQGVCTVKFIDGDCATAAVEGMDGGVYRGRTLRAFKWDGKRKFAAEKVQETEEDEARRLEAFSRELEGEEGGAEAGAGTRGADAGAEAQGAAWGDDEDDDEGWHH